LRQIKIAALILLAATLQSFLRAIWDPLVFVDIPLIVAVYFALQRDAVLAVIVGLAVGLATDGLSLTLLGANAFSKSMTAFTVASLATRIMIDNAVARIPVLAGAVMLDSAIYFLLHSILGQNLDKPFGEIATLRLIWTTVAGTALMYLLDGFFSERASQRKQLAFRRRAARRTLNRR
jgi:rod shape-determining protein MreD